jgi:hypothetical protein
MPVERKKGVPQDIVAPDSAGFSEAPPTTDNEYEWMRRILCVPTTADLEELGSSPSVGLVYGVWVVPNPDTKALVDCPPK